jgi:hypothetical protein
MAKRWQSDHNSVVKRLESNCKAIAMQFKVMQSDCKASYSDCEMPAKQLQSDYETIVK